MLTLLPMKSDTFDHREAIPRRDRPRSGLNAAARREGWDVFDCGPDPEGRPQLQLQREDCPEDGEPPFADDCDAWQHVVIQARAGSALHRAALAAVDDTERMLIEAACGAW